MPSTPIQPLEILALEPWLGGSHGAFLHAWSQLSCHEVQVLGLADRHWKWRMQAGAWELARELRCREAPDLLFVSDYVDLPRLLGFLPASWSDVPSVLYMHENQLTYPLRDNPSESSRDNSYGFTNILSCIRADAVVFNSEFHLDDFSQAAEQLLGRLPRPNPSSELRQRLKAATVISPGVNLADIAPGPGGRSGAPLRLLFSHRWQYDKDPLTFLETARRLASRGREFQLVLLGERFAQLPEGVEDALAALEPHIAHQGFLPSRADYAELLGSCDLAVSTAQHEFFGISTVEAMGAGVTPLLPDRLSYPEVIGVEPGDPVLYKDTDELLARLEIHAESPAPLRDSASRTAMRHQASRWSVEFTAESLDSLCVEVTSHTPIKTP